MVIRQMREPVRVEFHQSGGSTRVGYERVPGQWIDIPTDAIPRHLRALGSRFILVFQGITPERQDTAEELRVASQVAVEELGEAAG
jgi:hypothetical protein